MTALALCLWCAACIPAQAATGHSNTEAVPAVQQRHTNALFSLLPAVAAPSANGYENGEGASGGVSRDAGWSEDLLGGSFLGAVLFGHPYEGVGLVDIVLLAGIGLLAMNTLVMRRPGNKDDERFSVNRRGDLSGDRDTDDHSRKSTKQDWWHGSDRDDVHDRQDRNEAEPRHEGGQQEKDPWDNAWSRRIRGDQRRDDPQRGTREDSSAHRPVTVKDRAAAMWEHYSSHPEPETIERVAPTDGRVDVSTSARVPTGFEVQDFLEGARTLYVRLQHAWAERHLDSLEPFLTDDMMRLLQGQAEAHPLPETVDIIRVNATLQDVARTGAAESASVAFTSLMRIAGGDTAEEIREIWIFIRGAETQGMWRLSGIEAA